MKIRSIFKVICLTLILSNSPASGRYITDALVGYVDARKPQKFSETDWLGEIDEVKDLGGAGNTPVWQNDGRDGYQFTWTSNTGGGQITCISPLINSGVIDYDQDFTIELWARPTASSALADGRMHLFGNQEINGEGYRLTAKEESGDKFRIEFELADVTGETASYSVKTAANFNMGQWYQVVAAYDGSSGSIPVIKLYANGVEQTTTWTGDTTIPADKDFDINITPTIGARDAASTDYSDSARHYLAGDVAVARVYEKVLDGDEVLTNYYNEKPWVIDPPEPYDPNYPTYKRKYRENVKILDQDRKVTIAHDQNHYLCRADVIVTDSGKLLCVFLENNDHASQGNAGEYENVALTQSTDGGHTWHAAGDPSKPYELYVTDVSMSKVTAIPSRISKNCPAGGSLSTPAPGAGAHRLVDPL